MSPLRIGSGGVGDYALLRVTGAVDADSAHELGEALEGTLRMGKTRIVVTLAECAFMGSAGWGQLLSFVRHLGNGSGSMVIAGLSPTVKASYDLLGLNEILPEAPSEAEAIRRLAKSGVAPAPAPRTPS